MIGTLLSIYGHVALTEVVNIIGIIRFTNHPADHAPAPSRTFRPLRPCLARSKGAKSALGSRYPRDPGSKPQATEKSNGLHRS
jgi:hypothetical protein